MPHVLLVDDEEPLRASLSYTLSREGYVVTTASDGPTGLEMARERLPDVILLDVMLPGMDGIEVCQRIRAFSDVPILMLTAKDQGSDKVMGLEIGADDYVTKPFNTRELLARMKAVMRRHANAQRLLQQDRELLARMEDIMRSEVSPPAGNTADRTDQVEHGPLTVAQHGILQGGPVVMNLDSPEVSVDGNPIELSPHEFQLLRALLSHRGRVVTRTELIESVWGTDAVNALPKLDVHVRWLREKIEFDPSRPRYIATIPGIGYRFE